MYFILANASIGYGSFNFVVTLILTIFMFILRFLLAFLVNIFDIPIFGNEFQFQFKILRLAYNLSLKLNLFISSFFFSQMNTNVYIFSSSQNISFYFNSHEM